MQEAGSGPLQQPHLCHKCAINWTKCPYAAAPPPTGRRSLATKGFILQVFGNDVRSVMIHKLTTCIRESYLTKKEA